MAQLASLIPQSTRSYSKLLSCTVNRSRTIFCPSYSYPNASSLSHRMTYSSLSGSPVLPSSSSSSSSFFSTVASSSSAAKTMDWNTAKQLQNTEKLVIYYKTYCKFCNDIIDRLEDAGVSMKEVKLDKYENGNEIRDQLRSQTGQEHVPYIFLNGKLLPSEQTLLDLKAPGTKIKTLFEKEGLKVTGYFRT